ncbi:hypothetical protein NQ318_015861 [Aromia moschata]|uniref:VWFA domain-containing protein n=1 Tax=Aromia moschata TaxID=1265417 RepID=A0AAV8YRJ0_9CUCU|nr:hypothetical protein NQ318_015861 [Aromia moschata]
MFFELIIVSLIFSKLPHHIQCSPQGEQVDRWTQSIGSDLRMLGQAITRYSEIKQKYKYLNAKVREKNPTQLLADIKENVSRMIDRKMDAIECIQREAEKVAENYQFNKSTPFEYYSSKWSPVIGEKNTTIKLPRSLKENKNMYKSMKLNNDTHFYNLAVNTTHSSVHVPTNIYDKEEAAAFAIRWSEDLDKTFTQNYQSDPALSWQYFGSTSGIMRHYPAKRWEDHKKDLFDTRIRPWFIEAATCTKDVVILVDNSGSMVGMGHHIGSLTASSLLNTFSNNDFINVLNYSAATNYTIPCFADMLVQATRENVEMFKAAVNELKPEGKTALGQALRVAFDLLEEYRKRRGCVENNTNCNQAIMIITDGVNENLSNITMDKNYLNDGQNIPVRIFTYLVGKEVSNVEELKWISCANRGYFTHVQTLEQVTASVLQYISVIARPLVLQGEDHPISWTHANVDITYDDKNDDVVNEPYRLLTSVAIPCFDTKINRMNNTRTAYLLGVAGTDVPLEEFSKLMVPHKIGVNGYAFIVSNNGYVLMHPDLRPVFEGIMKDNYNSIDLTQVEQHNDGRPAREIGESLEKLRQALVDGEEGSMLNVKLSYHYDNRKRISEEYFDYYYTPLEKTPFTMCIAVPSTVSYIHSNAYGNYTLEVGDEIQKNRHTGQNFTTFFNGKWKIHPRWTYCKYHYLEGHEAADPESELVHFLNKMYGGNFTWERQYDEPGSKSSVDCVRKTLGDASYYCDKELIQKLIFDAEATNVLYSSEWQFNEREIALFKKFNASLRFVATMSGLTRWHYLFEEPKNDTKTAKRKEFGDLYPRAVNEKWYKSAVLQHNNDSEAFVYSVPFDAGLKRDTVITGSYAIFASDGGKEAPGSVVGFQFSQAKLRDKVLDISNKLSSQCDECLKCNGSLICYIIDSSGYIIVSVDNQNDTGKFFGEVEGDILDSMLQHNLYKRVTVYDYQALCKKDEEAGSAGSVVLTPLAYIKTVMQWIALKMVYFLTELSVYNILNAIPIRADEILNHNGTVDIPGTRTYYVKRIPSSNLIFVAIDPSMKKPDGYYFSTEPKRITEPPVFDFFNINTTLLPCQKRDLNNLYRRKLEGCYNEHPWEHEIVDCGKAQPFNKINFILFSLSVSVMFYA